MQVYQDTAIVLHRVEYGERDRILTLLTRDHGKVTVIAKGVRAARSKLAGGIELFSESQVSIAPGRGTMGTLVSSRLLRHHGGIVQDLERTNQAYLFLKTIHKIIENETGEEYYDVLAIGIAGLGDPKFDYRLVAVWFALHVLRLTGSLPNLRSQTSGQSFDFDYDKQQFNEVDEGVFSRDDLKVLRLCSTASKPPKLQQELGSESKLNQFTTALLQEIT